jgi:uncharacterized protein (TIGR01777 family)
VKVAVTGATGFIGSAVARALMRRGDAVVAYGRHIHDVRDKLPGASPMAWPPEPGEFPNVDAVVHLAGEPVAGRWSEEKKKAIRASRETGTRQLVAALAVARSRPGALISSSATGYYGDRGGRVLTEATAPGKDFLAEVCVAWEREARAAEELDVRVAMLRTGIVLGKGGGALSQMVPPFRLGLGGPIGGGEQWVPWVHLDDVVGLYLHLLDNHISGPVNGVSPAPVQQKDFAIALGRALNRPAFLPTPKFALRLLYGEFAETLFGSQRVVPEVAKQTGYTFDYPALGAALGASVGP